MKKIIITLAIITTIFSVSNICAAQILNNNSSDNSVTGKIMDNTDDATVAFGHVKIGGIIATIIEACLGLLAAIFLVLMIIAGFEWMTAAGNETKVEKAIGTIKTSIIGLIIVLAAYSITYFVFTYLPFSSNSAANTQTTAPSS